MFYINEDTLEYPVEEGFIRSEFPNTSFSTPFVAPPPYAAVNDTPEPAYNPMYQGIKRIQPQLIDGQYFTVWQVFELTPEQVKVNEDKAKQINKTQAAALLEQTDWSQQPDVANPAITPHLVNVNDFTAYRAALRAIAVNPPVSVDPWPAKPEEVWTTV